MQTAQTRDRLWWMAVAGLTLVGLALRVAAARGGLWTDEAWSVVYAAEARDPIGVFIRINHDNNHHLYSLWLQAIGPAASPMLARAPAVVAGSLCIVVAALIADRRSRRAGIVAALLFAISPSLVVFGSEARGYAMMLLAALAMLLLVSDAVDDRPARGAPWWLAAIAALGMLSHLTMAAPIGIAALWVYLERRRQLGPTAALPATLKLMGPALAATATVVLLVFTAAALSPTGMRVGGYEPFSASHYARRARRSCPLVGRVWVPSGHGSFRSRLAPSRLGSPSALLNGWARELAFTRCSSSRSLWRPGFFAREYELRPLLSGVGARAAALDVGVDRSWLWRDRPVRAAAATAGRDARRNKPLPGFAADRGPTRPPRRGAGRYGRAVAFRRANRFRRAAPEGSDCRRCRA